MLTSMDFLAIGQTWPPASELPRLEQYDDNRLLFKGEHQEVFNDWYRILRDDKKASLEIILNWPKRISTLFADLLLGEPPRIMAGDEESAEQLWVDATVENTALHITSYEVAIDTSRFGDGLYKVRLQDGIAVIEGVPPTIWFPVVARNNIRDISAHVLAWTFTVGTGQDAKTYLRAEIHTRGLIEYRMFRLEGGKLAQEEDGADFEPGWVEREQTGVPEFLVIPVSGMRTTDELHGIDDYGDLYSIIQEMEVRVAQIARILDVHADPKMYGSEDYITVNPQSGERELKAAGDKFFEVQPGEQPPGYLVWEGQLAAAFTQLDTLIKLFYVVSETSPAAFGQLEAGLAESGSALRRLMMAPLAKVNRVRLRFDPQLKRVLRVANLLERTKSGTTPEIKRIDVTWRDGLPEDESELVTNEVAAVNGGIRSKYLAVKKLNGGSEKDTQEELDRIAEDDASAAALAPQLAPNAISQPPEGDE